MLKIYCLLLTRVFKPLVVGFSCLSPPYCCSFSSLPAITSHSFAQAVWHTGLQPWPPFSSSTCLIYFQNPGRKHASRRLENRRKIFLNTAAVTPLEQTAWSPNSSLRWENLVSWYQCSMLVYEAFCSLELKAFLHWKSQLYSWQLPSSLYTSLGINYM